MNEGKAASVYRERERKRVCECVLERECRGGFYKEKKSTVSCWCCSSSRFALLEKSLACCFLSFDDDDGVDGSCWGRLTAEAGSGRGVQEAAGALLLDADVHSFLAFRSSAVVVVVAVAVAVAVAAAAGGNFPSIVCQRQKNVRLLFFRENAPLSLFLSLSLFLTLSLFCSLSFIGEKKVRFFGLSCLRWLCLR